MFVRLLLALSIVSIPLLRGQTSTGEIDVTVTDASEAIIVGARVTIVGADTGATARTVTTNTAGIAAVPLLNPATYNVKVEKDGFKMLVRQGVVLQVTEVVSLRVRLEVGAATQSVTITEQAPLVDTTTNTEGQVVGNLTMEELPLNGRNYTQLAVLTPGTVPSANKDQSFSAFGNRGMQNEYLLDGGLNESFIRGIDNHQRDAMRPSLEAIEEFKVQTSNYSAEYGSSAGGIVTVVTKSGTNRIHGSAFEFLRNADIAARDFFALPGPKPPLIFNQFGGSLGGPIRKNRAWIFGAYQGTRIHQSSINISTVPTAANRNGVFTQTIFDPYSTVVSGTTATRTPFPNNTIPTADFNSVGQKLVALYPSPNLPGAANNYNFSALQNTHLDTATFRGDVQVTSKDAMFARMSFNHGGITIASTLPEPADPVVVERLPAYNVGYGWTRVFSATLVNEFRFAWSRPEVGKDGTLARDPIIPNSLAPGVDSSIPTFGVTGFAGLGANPAGFGNTPLDKTSDLWEFSDTATKTIGAHLLKFGYTHQYVQMYTLTTLNGRGAFTFDGSYTENPQSRTTTGSGLADMELGLAQTVVTSTVGLSNLRANNDFWFIQDDWKVAQRLTLNVGLRYELYWPMYELNNGLANFVTDPSNPNFGKMIFADVNGQSRSMMDVDPHNFAPRFGFAWRVPHSADLVVRGGYGIFYGNPDEQTGVASMMTNNPPFVGLGGQNIIGDRNNPSTAFNLSNSLPPFPAPVTPQNFVFSPSSTATLYSWPTYYKAPIVQQWNLSFQKPLPDDIALEVSYVGNMSDGGWGTLPLGQPLTPGPGSVASRRPLLKYTAAPITASAPFNRSHYEGMAARLEKRMSKGLYFLASFSYGKAIDLSSGAALDGCGYCGNQEAVQNAYDLAAQRGPSDSNVTRRFVFSATWDLPFGKGKRYLSHGAGAAITGGWEVSGIWTAQDGPPFTLILPVDNANVGNTNWPNRICSGKLAHSTLQDYFDQSCFPTPPQYTFGNAGRNELYGPGVNNVDFTVHRFFPIPLHEGLKLEFRAEFFNLFNRPEFGIPSNTLDLPQTGQITSTSTAFPNRQVQFALKLLF
jgi:hypothetical protein